MNICEISRVVSSINRWPLEKGTVCPVSRLPIGFIYFIFGYTPRSHGYISSLMQADFSSMEILCSFVLKIDLVRNIKSIFVKQVS